MTDEPNDRLCDATSAWLTAMADVLSQEQLDLLRRAVDDPELEISVRVQLKAGRLALEVSDGVRKTDLAAVQVPGLRPSGAMH